MARLSRIQQLTQIVEAELDAGRPVPTRPQIAEKMGLRRDHDFGGRVTFELQKIKVRRGIASPADIAAVARKEEFGTYAPPVRLTPQQRIVRELQQEGLW